jgi:hypothetical protein
MARDQDGVPYAVGEIGVPRQHSGLLTHGALGIRSQPETDML